MLEAGTDPTNAAVFARAVDVVLTAFVVGFISWAFARRKNNSETDKNDAEADRNNSETIKNLTGVVRELQDDIDGFIVRVKGLQANVETSDDAKRQAEAMILTTKAAEAEKLADTLRDFGAEKARFLDAVVKMQMIVIQITRLLEGPDYNRSELRREAIRIAELLHFLKGQLEK